PPFEIYLIQPQILGHAGSADVKHQVKLLDDLIQNRLSNQSPRVAQVIALAGTFHLFRKRCIRSRRHSCQPIHKLVDRYLSPKSGKTVTTHPWRRPRASLSAATIAAPEDWP